MAAALVFFYLESMLGSGGALGKLSVSVAALAVGFQLVDSVLDS